MGLLTYTPPPLSGFVDLLWINEGDPPPHRKERLLPTGTVELVFSLRDDVLHAYDRGEAESPRRFRGPVVCGAHSEFFVIDTAQQAAVMGVHFKPGGAFPFLNLPAGELHNAQVPLDALWGRAAGALRDRVLEARTPAARFRALEQALLARAALPLTRHPAVAFALGEFQAPAGAPTVSDVTSQVGLSGRRFSEVFTREVGLTPKLFCRVRRFQRVLRLLARGREFDWARVALECGYFDQAHFNHDFRAFSGINPTTYLAQRTEHLNHVPLAE